MRHIMSTALVALIIGALAGASMGTIAQSDPQTQGDISTADTALNADRVDGKHAIGFTNRRGVRAGKLVATNKGGWLPSNIVQPYWGYIKNKPGILADHQISWSEVTDKPVALADGQIEWGEIASKPADFADNVDDAGVTAVKITTHSQQRTIGAGDAKGFYLYCPAGKATGGGYTDIDPTTSVWDATSYDDFYYVKVQNPTGVNDIFGQYVTCLTVQGDATVASRLTPAAKAAKPGK